VASQKDQDPEVARYLQKKSRLQNCFAEIQDSETQRITQKLRLQDAYNSAEIFQDPYFW